MDIRDTVNRGINTMINHWPIPLVLVCAYFLPPLPSPLGEILFFLFLLGGIAFDLAVIQPEKRQTQPQQPVPVGQAAAVSTLHAKNHSWSARTPEEIWADINSMIGLKTVKETLHGIQDTIEADHLRRSQGIGVSNNTLHMAFMGNPGTGKTAMARKVGELLYAIGALPGSGFVEADRSDLIAGFVGQTATKTTDKINEVLRQGGGVFFLDEAYGLSNAAGESSDFGKEAVEILIKAMEDHRDKLCVIMAGYTKEMEHFIYGSNPGLKSRIAYTIDFPDYSTEELLQILELWAKDINCRIDADALDKVRAYLPSVNLKTEGNARHIRNLLDKARQAQSKRILQGDDAQLLIADDFNIPDRRKAVFGETVDKIWADINSMIGLETVKETLHSIQDTIEINIQKSKQGMNVDTGTLHMIFTGNPGTGKTEMARKVGELLCAIGALLGNGFVEVKKENLVGSHVGDTEKITMDKINEILRKGGGVLFIDEAYTLLNDTFGTSALDVIMTAMENYRDKLCVIFAGYSKEMGYFIDHVNPGLKSRIAYTIDFPDYSTEELLQILELQANRKQYVIQDAALEKVRQHLLTVNMQTAGNGRYVRKLLEQAERTQSGRLKSEGSTNYRLLTADDFKV